MGDHATAAGTLIAASRVAARSSDSSGWAAFVDRPRPDATAGPRPEGQQRALRQALTRIGFSPRNLVGLESSEHGSERRGVQRRQPDSCLHLFVLRLQKATQPAGRAKRPQQLEQQASARYGGWPWRDSRTARAARSRRGVRLPVERGPRGEEPAHGVICQASTLAIWASSSNTGTFGARPAEPWSTRDQNGTSLASALFHGDSEGARVDCDQALAPAGAVPKHGAV